jgi:hypothetical protein
MSLPSPKWLLIPAAAAALLAWKYGHRQTSDRASIPPVSTTAAALLPFGEASGPAAWEAALAPLTVAEATREILRILESGHDVKTGRQIEIGENGVITGFPSLRTYLLDKLAALDPEAAAAAGHRILRTPTTADEWTVALRNIAAIETSPAAADFLRLKTEELIRHPEWRSHPTVGYLNAFDVLVHTGATASTPLLSELVRQKERKDLAHAAFLTLDRLVLRDPQAMLTLLAADQSLQQSRPEMVAQQFARADLRVAGQREIVRNWLLSPARTANELAAFAAVYPNQNRFVSHHLLSREIPVSGTDLAAHDREVLGIIRGWQADDSFRSVAPYLGTVSARLSEFTGSDRE